MEYKKSCTIVLLWSLACLMHSHHRTAGFLSLFTCKKLHIQYCVHIVVPFYCLPLHQTWLAWPIMWQSTHTISSAKFLFLIFPFQRSLYTWLPIARNIINLYWIVSFWKAWFDYIEFEFCSNWNTPNIGLNIYYSNVTSWRSSDWKAAVVKP